MAADTDSTVRQRKPTEAEKEQLKTPESKVVDREGGGAPSIFVDFLRLLTFLLLASCGLSYLISGGESFFWGMKNPPDYLRRQWWKQQFTPAVYMTLEELAAHDGSDPSKPLYLAINGTIYDVSANMRVYGPQGSYHAFAAKDASRAFVTGCFAEDQTGDMRGVEDMFLPLDDPETDRHWTKAELAALREKERAEARKRAYDGLKHWVDFFKKSKKYSFVGYVKRPEGWPGMEPVRPLCAQAQGGRKKREVPKEES